MSDIEFIYPAHPIFEAFREIAETTELGITVDTENGMGTMDWREHPIEIQYDRGDVPFELAFRQEGWNFATAPPYALEPGYAQRWFWLEHGGINTLSYLKRWPGSLVNSGHRVLRDSWHDRGVTPQANEILAHGVGTLRSVKEAHPKGGYRAFCGETAARIDSERCQQLGVYIVDITVHDGTDWVPAPHALESVNVIMPEILGELRQLSERREEKDFINAYLRDLLETFRLVAVGDSSDSIVLAPKDLVGIKPKWRDAHLLHLKSGLWNAPPASEAELIDRVDELLDRIVIDSDPIEVIGKS